MESLETKGPACSNCHRDRQNDKGATAVPHSPCPDCGSPLLTFSVHVHETLRAIVDTVSLVLQPGSQERDWKTRWRQVQDRAKKLSEPHTEQLSGESIRSAAQDIFEFFVSAYHLKDSLIQDGAESEANVEAAINTNYELSLLADIANQDKHRKLTRHPRSGFIPTILSTTGRSSGDKTWELVLEISHNGKKINGVDFVSSVISTWETVLRNFNLI